MKKLTFLLLIYSISLYAFPPDGKFLYWVIEVPNHIRSSDSLDRFTEVQASDNVRSDVISCDYKLTNTEDTDETEIFYGADYSIITGFRIKDENTDEQYNLIAPFVSVAQKELKVQGTPFLLAEDVSEFFAMKARFLCKKLYRLEYPNYKGLIEVTSSSLLRSARPGKVPFDSLFTSLAYNWGPRFVGALTSFIMANLIGYVIQYHYHNT